MAYKEGGDLLSDIRLDYKPVVQTRYEPMDDLPPMMDYDIRKGRTYMYARSAPLYPFGFGLSYTTFAYSKLKTSADAIPPDGSIDVSVDVKNTGRRAGEEVVQLYVSHVGSSVERPIKELKGFRRVMLKAGETKTVTIPLKAADLAYWDASKKAWVVEADTVKLMVGGSSADLKLEKTILGARASRPRS